MILQACPSCNRQYDVTHLGVGDRVRCVCDGVFAVKRAKELTVQARKCANCGGRIEPGQTQCAYCQAELSAADASSTLCPSCFKRMAQDAKHCPSCGIPIAPQALTAIPDGRRCPRCEGELLMRSLGESSVIECAACQGLWVKREDFEAFCRRAQERPDVVLEADAAAGPVRSSEPERKVFYVDCPTCGAQMVRRMFRYKDRPSHVIIDFCRDHGVWFDRAELERIVAFVRSRADVERPFDVADSLGLRRPPSTVPLGTAGTLGAISAGALGGRGHGGWNTVGAFLLADVLGEVLGGLLGGLFD